MSGSPDKETFQRILRRAPSHEIVQAAQERQAMRTLRQDGFQKVVQGMTTPEEVRARVDAGASFIVIGTALERSVDPGYVEELVAAAHVAQPHPI